LNYPPANKTAQYWLKTSLFLLSTLIIFLFFTGRSDPLVALTGQVIKRYSDVPVIDADLSINGDISAIMDINQKLAIWNNKTLQLVNVWSAKHFNQVQYHVVLSGDNQVVATAGKNWLSLFSTSTGEKLYSWQVSGFDPAATISQLLLDGSGNKIFIGLTEGSIVVVDLTKSLRSQFQLHDGVINKLLLAEKGEAVFSTSFDGMANLWQINTGNILWQKQQKFRITALALDRLNQKVFISDALKSQQILNFSLVQEASQAEYHTSVQLDYLQRFRTFRAAIFLADGRNLVTASSKYQIYLWDVKSGKELAQGNIRSYSMGSTVLDFARDHQGNFISLSSDGVIECWSTADVM